jgi:uncharacterized protein YcgI (DUF1989 family)
MCRPEEDRQMKRVFDHVMPPKLRLSLVVKKEQSLRIIDLEGTAFHLLWR